MEKRRAQTAQSELRAAAFHGAFVDLAFLSWRETKSSVWDCPHAAICVSAARALRAERGLAHARKLKLAQGFIDDDGDGI